MTDLFPGCFVDFPVNVEGRSAAFFLSAEEFLAMKYPEDNYVFFWQLNPTCVFGRNQRVRQELNVDFCQANGIELVRRKSGGGTIFADRDNIMVSLVTGEGSVEPLFDAFANNVANGLRKLGAPTKVSGRNDIVLEDGRKICGNAFYHLPHRNIVHCTMLYDTDMELMMGSLTPPSAKLETKGVKSVRSRIGLLKEFFSFGVDQLRIELRHILTDRSIQLTLEDVREIEQIEKTYHLPSYIFGSDYKDRKADFTKNGYIHGCGKLELNIFAGEDGRIEYIDLHGDFFDTDESSPEKTFNEIFRAVPLWDNGKSNRLNTEIKHIILEKKPNQSIRNLSEAALICLLFEENQ